MFSRWDLATPVPGNLHAMLLAYKEDFASTEYKENVMGVFSVYHDNVKSVHALKGPPTDGPLTKKQKTDTTDFLPKNRWYGRIYSELVREYYEANKSYNDSKAYLEDVAYAIPDRFDVVSVHRSCITREPCVVAAIHYIDLEYSVLAEAGIDEMWHIITAIKRDEQHMFDTMEHYGWIGKIDNPDYTGHSYKGYCEI
jgi:hypothetical protein